MYCSLQPRRRSHRHPLSPLRACCSFLCPARCHARPGARVTNRSIWMHGRGAVRSDSQRRVGGCAHRIMGIRQTITDHNRQNARPWAGAWPTRGTGNPTPCETLIPPRWGREDRGPGGWQLKEGGQRCSETPQCPQHSRQKGVTEADVELRSASVLDHRI